MRRIEFSKWIIIFETVIVALVTWKVLAFAELCILLNYSGSLGLLTPIITASYAAYGTSVSFYYTKAKAENLSKMTGTETVSNLPVGYNTNESQKGTTPTAKKVKAVDADPI